jgi:hypothetical protein
MERRTWLGFHIRSPIENSDSSLGLQNAFAFQQNSGGADDIKLLYTGNRSENDAFR